MASVRKQKPTMEPSMPTRGRIHIFKVWREQSLTVDASVVSRRRSSDVGHPPHYNRVLNLQAGKSRRAQLLPSLPKCGPSFDDDGPQTCNGRNGRPDCQNARVADNGLSIAITRQPTEISTTRRGRRGWGSLCLQVLEALKPAAFSVGRTFLSVKTSAQSNHIYGRLPNMSRPEDTL